jgi:hypothetical protein
MTTFDLTGFNGGTTGGTENRNDAKMPVVVESLVDFSSTVVPNSGFPAFTPNTTTLSGNASGDTVKVFNIPAVAGTATSQQNSYGTVFSATFGQAIIVNFAGLEVVVADSAGNSGTLQVTDGTQTYTGALTVQTTGVKAITSPPNKLYTAAATLNLAVGTGAVNCVVRVFAQMTDISATNQIIWF